MKATHTALVTALFCAGLASAVHARGAKHKKGAAAAQAAMMEAFKKAGTPGAAHEVLHAMSGNWRVKATMWPAPGAPPQRSNGKAKAKMVLGKRFLRQTYRGTFMGKPFDGMALVGYDNIAKKYVSTWADSMSTTLMTSQGEADATRKVITYTTQYSCPIVNGPKQSKMVVRLVNKNKYTMEMYDRDPKGKEFKAMELVYTRGS